MKMYIERASNQPLGEVEGFTFTHEPYQYHAMPGGPIQTRDEWTVEVETLEDLLKLTEKVGQIALEFDPKFPPSQPRQHIPNLTIVDAEL